VTASSPQRIAAIDIGTNAVLLLVASRHADGRLVAEHESCTITRLGQAVDREHNLARAAIERTLATLTELADLLERLGVGKDARVAVGTSALRDAGNAPDFIRPAEAILRCPIEVVSGEREAQLVLAGVRGSFGELPERTLLFDVGGGSTELILTGGSTGVLQLDSLDLGAVRLTERHLAGNSPPSPAAVDEARREIAAALDGLSRSLAGERRNVDHLIGIAGTVTTIAAVEMGLIRYDTERVNGLWLTAAQVAEQARRYASLPLDQRREIVGLDPGRADIILAGALVVAAVLEHFRQGRFRVCDRGVRWGLLQERTGARRATPPRSTA
jgi:exopolyphosphatase/guanosine-5'-triphosphate,3'-diphosphate pyrophosphatase